LLTGGLLSYIILLQLFEIHASGSHSFEFNHRKKVANVAEFGWDLPLYWSLSEWFHHNDGYEITECDIDIGSEMKDNMFIQNSWCRVDLRAVDTRGSSLDHILVALEYRVTISIAEHLLKNLENCAEFVDFLSVKGLHSLEPTMQVHS
jgi:hypothetical protein